MKLVLHLVAKDLRRLRWWLLCWVAVLALPVLLGALLLVRSPWPLPGGDWNLPNVHGGLVALEGLVAYLLAILLVHDDSLAGTRQFWVTRPISGARLLAAKIVAAIVMLGLIPWLVSLPWWLWCGFDFLQIAAAARDLAVFVALIALPAALLAVLTDTLARAILWSTVLAAFVVAAVSLYFSAMQGRFFGEAGVRAALAMVVILSAMILMIACRYLWRQHWWPLGVIAGVMVGSVANVGPVARSLSSRRPDELNTAQAAAIRLEHQLTLIRSRPYGLYDASTGRREPHQSVNTVFRVSGVPQDRILLGLTGGQTWKFTDGMRTERDVIVGNAGGPLVPGLHRPTSDPETEAWRREKREEALNARLPARKPRRSSFTFPELAPSERQLTAYAVIPPSIAARVRAEQPPYEADLWLVLTKPTLPCEEPLVPGRWMARHGHGLRIDRVERYPDRASVTAVSTRPNTWPGFSSERSQSMLLRELAAGFVQINRSREEFRSISRGKPLVLSVNGVEINWRVLTIEPERVIRSGLWVERPGWFEQTTLAEVVLEPEVVFHRQLRVEKPIVVSDEDPTER